VPAEPGPEPDGSAPRPRDEAGPSDDAVLGRVADPAALDADRGTRVTIDVVVPARWSGRRVRVTTPRRFRCSRCAGGGCDACGRSGAIVVRAPAYRGAPDDDAHEPSFEMQLPPAIGVKPVLVRIPHPFGDDAGVDQLHVVVEDGPADPRVVLVDGGPPSTRSGSRAWLVAGIALVIALFALLRALV
jgi:hypothetical protein